MIKRSLGLTKLIEDLHRITWPFIQTLLLIIMLISIPFYVSWYFFYVKEIEYTLKQSFICFIVGIIIFHLYFWVMKDRSSKNITKYVDYVYLTVAAIGLLSASDYDLKKYNRSVAGLVYYAQSSLLGDKYRLEEYYKKSCTDIELDRCKNITNVISRINDASKFFKKEADNNVMKYPSTEVYNMGNYVQSVLSAFKKVDAETVEAIGGLEAKYLQQSIDRYRIPPFGSGDMIHKEEGFERQFDVDGFKGLGYLLIAAALSLRISRVTVELRSWWKKAT